MRQNYYIIDRFDERSTPCSDSSALSSFFNFRIIIFTDEEKSTADNDYLLLWLLIINLLIIISTLTISNRFDDCCPSTSHKIVLISHYNIY
jgi:hypothetical protein